MNYFLIKERAYRELTQKLQEVTNKAGALVSRMEPPASPQWLDSRLVCRALNISKRTLQYYRESGKLPFSFIGGKVFFHVPDIVRVLEANKNNPEKP